MQFDLNKSLAEIHIFEGYKIAIDNIDEVIAIIKSSQSISDAKDKHIERFGLSEAQAQAVVEMTLGKMCGMERTKVVNSIAKLTEKVKNYTELIADMRKIRNMITEKLNF